MALYPAPVPHVPKLAHSPLMNLRIRLAWLAIILTVQWLYFPINQSVQGGVVLNTPLDVFIPLWPIWAVPYLLSLPWWIIAYTWAALKMPAELYRTFVAATIGVMLTSYMIFIAYPTYIERPILEGTDWTIELIRFIYSQDRIYNAFPSGHTYSTILIALFWWNWQSQLRWLWAIITMLILISTLFTRQHNLPDLIGGIVLACAGYRLSLLWIARRHKPHNDT